MLIQYDLPTKKTPNNIHTSVVHDWANSNKNVEKSSIFCQGTNKLPLSLSRVGR